MVKIGWSHKNISNGSPVCIPGQFHMRVSKGVLDSSTLTALTVHDGHDYVIFLSCDIEGTPEGILKGIREKVESLEPEIDGKKILMNVTHTHCGPLLDVNGTMGVWGTLDELPHEGVEIAHPGEYTEFFIDTAASAIVESFNNRCEGSISYGYGYAVVAHSRRCVYFDDLSKRDGSVADSRMVNGHAAMYGNTNDDMFSHYEAGADHFANFMFTFDKCGKLTGAIVNVPCPSQNSEQEWMLSADYWHDVKSEIKKKYGDIYILPQCAAAGDLSPRVLHYNDAQNRRYRLKYSDYKVDERVDRKTEMYTRRDIAERISEAFSEVYSWASKEKFTDVPIVHSVKTIELDKRIITDEEYRYCLAEKEKCKVREPFATEGEPLEKLVKNSMIIAKDKRYNNIIERYEAQKTQPKHPMELHVIKIGEIAFASNQFELYMDYQHRIQARSPFIQTFVVQLCAQPEFRSGSYLATERGVWGAGYSATMFCNRVSPSGGQQLVEETVNELKKIY